MSWSAAMRPSTTCASVTVGWMAFAIAGRSRIGARALGTHAQQPAFVHARDGAAARADGMDIEHRHADRKSVDGSLQGFARLAVAQAYVGGRAAHIEAENARESGELGYFERADHAAGGSGEHGADRVPARFLGRHETAVRLHDRDRVAPARPRSSSARYLSISGPT